MSTPSLGIDAAVYPLLEAFELPPELGFGMTRLPLLYRAICEDGRWLSRDVLPYQPINLDPAAKVLHYGQEVFEGLKAYSIAPGDPTLFRPEENFQRMNRSARRLCMPDIPQAVFMEGVCAITALARDCIPRRSGQSLYLRPFMIGVDAALSLGASRRHEFYVIASPSQVYHQGRMKVLVERDDCRASVGGTGHVKVGGNYAAAQAAAERARDGGFDQTLWLDPVNRRDIEELSGMNLFAVIDGELHTPALSGSILPGITRESLITLARHQGRVVFERPIALDELLARVDDGRCSELFACGTAAVVSSVSVVAEHSGEQRRMPEPSPVADQLRDSLVAIQEGRATDQFGWNYPVSRAWVEGAVKSGSGPVMAE